MARNIQTAGAGLLLQATPTQTGRFGTMYDCADAGMRTIGYGGSDARGFYMHDVNGSAIALPGGHVAGGQITISGWRNAAAQFCGRADVLAVIVFDRAITSADMKQVHRRFASCSGRRARAARTRGPSPRSATALRRAIPARRPALAVPDGGGARVGVGRLGRARGAQL